MKNDKSKDNIDLGEWLYQKRKEKGYTEDDLVEKINMINVEQKNIKKWERDLEFPNLDVIYKLSEIYEIPSEEILNIKDETLKNGVLSIHKQLIGWISLFMGISIYGTIWFCRIFLSVVLILTLIWFANLR